MSDVVRTTDARTAADPTGDWPLQVFKPLPPDEAKGLRDYGVDDTADEPPEPDGECYRGGEYAASVAHEMAEARKLK